MKTYTLQAVQDLQDKYIKKGGDVVVTHDGVLLDDYIFFGHNLKTTVITAVYLNDSSSAYTARSYKKTPKKYLHLTS